MIRATIIALATVSTLSFSAAQAQTVDIGPGGVGVDLRSPRQRERDVQREEWRRDREFDRRRAERRDRELTTGSIGRCREITVREEDDYGRLVTRRTQECR